MNINNLLIGTVYAETLTPNGSSNSVESLINNAVSGLGYLVAAAALFGIIYSGFLFMTSGGNPERLARAKRALLYSILAILLVVLAVTIVRYLVSVSGSACLLSGIGCTNF